MYLGFGFTVRYIIDTAEKQRKVENNILVLHFEKCKCPTMAEMLCPTMAELVITITETVSVSCKESGQLFYIDQTQHKGQSWQGFECHR